MQTPLQQAISLIEKRQRQLKLDHETSAISFIESVAIAKQISAIDEDLATLRGLLEVEQEVIEQAFKQGYKDGSASLSKYFNGLDYFKQTFNQQ